MQKQHLTKSFTIKTLKKLGIKGNFFYWIKGIHKKPTANIIPSSERLKACPLKSATRYRCLFSILLFNIVPEVLAG